MSAADIERVAVIGAGVMGAGIAQALAQAGCTVVCTDIDPAVLEIAHGLVQDGRYGIVRAVERGKLSAEDGAATLERLSWTTDLAEAVAGVDLVVEAVPEDLALKVKVFRDLDRLAPSATILASNSSGLPVAALAAATDRPAQVLAWHWSSPAQVMRMAEIVVTPQTDEAVTAAVSALAERAGKRPVVVKDHPTAWGYVGNRIWGAALREARAVVAEGVASPEEVDTILTTGWNWPAGPFAMLRGAGEGWGDQRSSSITRGGTGSPATGGEHGG